MKWRLTFFLVFIASLIVFGQDTENFAPQTLGSSYNSRIALVIGNATYPEMPLKNPANDAVAITRELEKAGFEVISYTDLDRRGMRNAIRQFGERVNQSKGVGLFYYAGHGLQAQGVNYLVPVDADIQFEYEIEDMCVRADQVLRMLELYENPLNIIIIDACRNNPFGSKFRSMGRGLAMPETAPVGTIIGFATAPGKTASDGTGDNGLYTQEFIKAMNTPGLPIEQLFKKVRINVLQQSEWQQSPWENSSLIGDFYFYPEESDVKVARIEENSENLYYNFTGITFYEADGVNFDNKVFTDRFGQQSARYIYTQINLDNKKYGQEDWKTNFIIKIFKPSGALWTELSTNNTISQSDSRSHAALGWGWPAPGSWQGGEYKVEIWDDDVKVGEDSFVIEGNNLNKYDFLAINFYESETPEKFSNSFDIFESTYISTHLTLKNNSRDANWSCKLSARYYKPDGTYFGEVAMSQEVLSSEDRFTVSRAFGYADVGNWIPGVYKVEVWDGDTKIAQDSFEMIDNRENYSGNYRLQSVKFYESDSYGELTEYKSEFDRAGTRYINAAINFVNFLHEKEDWTTNFEIKFYKPDGTLWTKLEKRAKVTSDLDFALVSDGWGWDNPGNWIPGEYKVELLDGGKLLATEYFTITKSNYRLNSVDFYEGPGETGHRSPYDSVFKAQDTRFIHVDLNCFNEKFEEEDWTSNFTVKYFYPDGSLFGEFPINSNVPQTLDYFYVTRSYGFAEPGKWTTGEYKVEVWDNDNLINTSYFKIQ